MKSICFILTTEQGVKAFLLEHIRALSNDFKITVVVNTKEKAFLSKLGLNASVIPIEIKRNISLLNDIVTLFQIIYIIRRHQFDAVHTVTPKAGLLGMLASYFSFIPYRIHTYTGQVWANKKNIKRLLLKSADRFYGSLATHVIVDSPSQLDFLISEGVIDKKKAFVFGKGSICGVDVDKFKPNPQVRKQLRSELKVKKHELLFFFLGRLNTDKGVLDLAHAFIKANILNCKLLFVGPDEGDMQAKIASLPKFDSTKISFIGYTDQPQKFMVAADVLCLPSYREGFGSVIIEAAACGTPAIASRIYGITDAIDENFTGLMHEAGNVSDLQSKLEQMAKDEKLRERLGKQAYHRAINDFNSELITQAWCDFYRDVVFKHD